MSRKLIPDCEVLSAVELDEKLAEAVVDSQRSERLICFYLLEMSQRRGYEKFGYKDVWDYASARFGYSSRKTGYFLGLAQRLKRLPKLLKALEDGEIGWTKAYQIARVADPQTEEERIEKSKDLSVRDLEEMIKSRKTNGGRPVKLWMCEVGQARGQQARQIETAPTVERIVPGQAQIDGADPDQPTDVGRRQLRPQTAEQSHGTSHVRCRHRGSPPDHDQSISAYSKGAQPSRFL